MRSLVNNFIEQKNKVGDKITPIYLYEIRYDATSNSWLYYSSFGQDVIFNGRCYTAFPIQHSNIKEDANGTVNRITLNLGNETRSIQYYLDTYSGLKGCKINIIQIWHEHLDDPTCYLQDIYYVESSITNQKQASLILSAEFDVMDIRTPHGYFSRYRCRFTFKGNDCGYAGGETTCNKTMARCTELGNISRFGAFPGIPMKRTLIKI